MSNDAAPDKGMNQLLAEQRWGGPETAAKVFALLQRHGDTHIQTPQGRTVRIHRVGNQHFYFSGVPGVGHVEARQNGEQWVDFDEFTWFTMVVITEVNPGILAMNAGCVSVFPYTDAGRFIRKEYKHAFKGAAPAGRRLRYLERL